MNKTCFSWSELGSELPCVVFEMMIAWKALPAIQSPGFVSVLSSFTGNEKKRFEFHTPRNMWDMVFLDI